MSFTVVNRIVSIDETNFSVFTVRYCVHTYVANQQIHTDKICFIIHQ